MRPWPIVWMAVALILLSLFGWQAHRRQDVSDVTNLSVLNVPVEDDRCQDDWNVWAEGKHYELDRSAEEIYHEVAPQLAEKGWTSCMVYKSRRKINGVERFVGFTRSYELHKGNVDLYFGFGPSVRRKDPAKTDAWLTAFHYHVRPFWESMLHNCNLGP